jgi:chemotaxis methyl-accepting protein methylase
MVSIKDFNNDLLEIFDEDDLSDEHIDNKQDRINDLLTLSSLMSPHINSDDFLSSESRLVRSKFQRLLHFLTTDVYNEPMTQALGDRISNLAEVDDALINLNRNATLKFRNYKQFREQVRLIYHLRNTFIELYDIFS